MHKHMMALAVAGVATFASFEAKAQLGQQGDVSFAGDRLMGIYLVDDAPGDGVTAGIGAPPLFFGFHPYTGARLGIDFFVIDQLSLGGSLAIFAGDSDTAFGDDDFSGVLFAPRVGYAIPFSDAFGIWPRGGLTIWNVEGNDEVALTGEAMFFATPGDKWGFLFGPTLDVGIAGEGDEALSFGIVSAGVFGWL